MSQNILTVSTLDLNRYLGRWHEIARFNHTFERGLYNCVAEYSWRADGLIKVCNIGFKNGNPKRCRQITGKAKRPSEDDPGKLKVSFFWNFYSDYWVLELAADYRFALVGSRRPSYLWILSRTPQITQADRDFLLGKAASRGYDLHKLIWTQKQTY